MICLTDILQSSILLLFTFGEKKEEPNFCIFLRIEVLLFSGDLTLPLNFIETFFPLIFQPKFRWS